jgi:hypothetical protein
MENLDKTPSNSTLAMCCFPDADDDSESMVVFELLVPVGAKVPAPRQHVEFEKLMVQQGSVSSTVPGTIVTQLQVNNTASGSAWCVTATLVAPRTRRHSLIY